MGIPMHDHTKRPNAVWCPLMKEVCEEGWTKSMGGGGIFGGKEKPRCVRWRGVFVSNPLAVPQVQEVFDCVDGWTPDLLQQVAQETYQGAAATEEARNHIKGQAGTFRQMGLAFRAMARRNGVTSEDIKQIEAEDHKALELKGNAPPQIEGGK